MSDITNISTEELKKELQRREAEERRIREEKAAAQRQLWLDNVHLLMKLVPEHNRNNCSDDNPHNVHRCQRCNLIEAAHCYSWPEDMTVQISIEYPRPT